MNSENIDTQAHDTNLFKCEELLIKGYNICSMPNLEKSIVCPPEDQTKCKDLTYCSYNLNHPEIDFQNKETTIENPKEFRSEKFKYINMLRFTCKKETSPYKCPAAASSGGTYTLTGIGQSQSIAHSWRYMDTIEPYYCGQKINTDIKVNKNEIDLSKYKLQFKVIDIKNVELVIQMMPSDQFVHLGDSKINQHLHMHGKETKSMPASGWDMLIYYQNRPFVSGKIKYEITLEPRDKNDDFSAFEQITGEGHNLSNQNLNLEQTSGKLIEEEKQTSQPAEDEDDGLDMFNQHEIVKLETSELQAVEHSDHKNKHMKPLVSWLERNDAYIVTIFILAMTCVLACYYTYNQYRNRAKAAAQIDKSEAGGTPASRTGNIDIGFEDENDDQQPQHMMKSTPTFVVLDEDEMHDEKQGRRSLASINEAIRQQEIAEHKVQNILSSSVDFTTESKMLSQVNLLNSMAKKTDEDIEEPIDTQMVSEIEIVLNDDIKQEEEEIMSVNDITENPEEKENKESDLNQKDKDQDQE